MIVNLVGGAEGRESSEGVVFQIITGSGEDKLVPPEFCSHAVGNPDVLQPLPSGGTHVDVVHERARARLFGVMAPQTIVTPEFKKAFADAQQNIVKRLNRRRK